VLIAKQISQQTGLRQIEDARHEAHRALNASLSSTAMFDGLEATLRGNPHRFPLLNRFYRTDDAPGVRPNRTAQPQSSQNGSAAENRATATLPTGSTTAATEQAPQAKTLAEAVTDAIQSGFDMLGTVQGASTPSERSRLRQTLEHLTELTSEVDRNPEAANGMGLRQISNQLHEVLVKASPMEALSPTDLAARTKAAAAKVPSQALHVEQQSAAACGVHAINAFLGGPVMTPHDFDDWTNDLRAGLRNEVLRGLGAMQSSTAGTDVLVVHTMLQKLSAKQDGDRPAVGIAFASARPPAARIAQVALPPGLEQTDRAVIEVKTGKGTGSQASDHYVAFRKDEHDEWWLLDSRSTEIGSPTSPDTRPGVRKEQISPQAWMDRLTALANVQAVVLMAPGIDRDSLKIQ
jgi:hypothetical protein